MGQPREVAASRTPEGRGSAWEAAAWENQGNKLRRNALVPQVPSGSVWTPPPPPSLASTSESLSSAGEASRNLHQGVKLHTAAGQWPTAPARCVNTRGLFLALQVGLGGTYFSRGEPERRDLPGTSGQGLRSVGSSPTRGCSLQGRPFSGGRGLIRSGTWLIDSPKER